MLRIDLEWKTRPSVKGTPAQICQLGPSAACSRLRGVEGQGGPTDIIGRVCFARLGYRDNSQVLGYTAPALKPGLGSAAFSV